MKFSKSSWISLALGVVVIAAIMVGLIRTQQNQTQKELEKNLSEAQQNLAQIDID